MTLVVPRILNSVSCVTRISYEIHFSWQAQYLVKLKSLFVAGVVFGEIWNDSRSAKCCIFQYKMLVVGVKSNLGCEAGCGVTVSCSGYGRIMLGSFSERSRIGRALELTFHLFWRNVSEILEHHLVWQAQYLVMLEDATCCSAHYK